MPPGASASLSGIVLSLLGAGITLITGRSLLMGGGRQLAFGVAAATFGIGSLVGQAVV